MLSLYNVCVCLSVRTSKHFIIIIITGIIILNQVAMFCWPAGGVCPAVEEGRDHLGRGGEGHQLCGYQDIYSACKYQGLNDHQFCWLQWRTLAHPMLVFSSKGGCHLRCTGMWFPSMRRISLSWKKTKQQLFLLRYFMFVLSSTY